MTFHDNKNRPCQRSREWLFVSLNFAHFFPVAPTFSIFYRVIFKYQFSLVVIGQLNCFRRTSRSIEFELREKVEIPERRRINSKVSRANSGFFHLIFFHLSFVENCVEFAINCIASRVRQISSNPTTCRHCVGVTKLDPQQNTEYLRAAYRSASLRNENWIHGFSLQSYSWFGFLTVLLLCVHFGCGLLDLCDAECQRRPSATQITTKRKLKRRRRRRRRVNEFCTFASSFLVNWVRLQCLCSLSLCLALSRIHGCTLFVRLVNRNEAQRNSKSNNVVKMMKI